VDKHVPLEQPTASSVIFNYTVCDNGNHVISVTNHAEKSAESYQNQLFVGTIRVACEDFVVTKIA